MSRELNLGDALDASLDRLAQGATVSQCLHDYPQYARELRPLLEVARKLHRAPAPEPHPEAVREGYARMMAAVEAKSWSAQPHPARASQPATAQTSGAARRPARTEERPGFFQHLKYWPAQRWIRLGAAAAILCLLIGLGWLWQAAELTTILSSGLFNPVEAMIVETEGTVLHLPSGTRIWQPVKAGQLLSAGDRIQTVGESHAEVALGRVHRMALADATEVFLTAVPSRWSPLVMPQVYQVAGGVRYAADGEAAAAADVRGWGVKPAMAATPRLASSRSGVYLTVQSPVLSVRAERAAFVMAVEEDGATAVAVDDGEVTVSAGNAVMMTQAGETAVLRAATRTGLGELELRAGGFESLEDAGFTPVDLPLWEGPSGDAPSGGAPSGDAPGTPTDTPAGDLPVDGEDADPDDSDDDGVPPDTPPGLEDTDGVPPGLEDEDGVPPGQAPDDPGDDEEDIPPGLEDSDGVPPGLEDKDGVPPGQAPDDPGDDEEPDVPPGLEDKGGVPPGQVPDDPGEDEEDVPPGLEDKGGVPPGQSPGDPGDDTGPPDTPPGQEDKDNEPPGQSPGDPGDDNEPPDTPPGQEDKDNEPPDTPPGQEDKDTEPPDTPPGQGKKD